MDKRKKLQTVHTKQSITYPKARKIIEVKTQNVEVTYAAMTSKSEKKNYQSIGIQAECFNSSNSECLISSLNSKI